MHSRVRTTTRIALADIQTDPDFVIDEHFVELIVQLEKGRIKCAYTRLPVTAIISGFYQRGSDETMHVTNLKKDYLTAVQSGIRGGSRPIMDVYWSPLAPNGGCYVCPDDELVMAAYKILNFEFVPCRILRPKQIDALEGSIWLERRGKQICLAKAVAPTVESVASFVGDAKLPFHDLTRLLKEKCSGARESLVSFHEDDGSNIHYHHILHALLRRHERLLDSIDRMVGLGRSEHAAVLVRVVYEAFLNFYIDWLSPEFFGPRFQLLAAIRQAKGQGMNSSSEHLGVLGNLVFFMENTSKKAQVSPLGSIFHNAVYPPLSLIAHQSYTYVEHEAADFYFTDQPDPPSRVEQIGRWLDVLTATMIVRIKNETGWLWTPEQTVR